MVQQTKGDTKHHVDDAQNYWHLHFEGVKERQLVGSNIPDLEKKILNKIGQKVDHGIWNSFQSLSNNGHKFYSYKHWEALIPLWVMWLEEKV